MNSSLISGYSDLHNSSFRIKLAMELNSSNYAQIGDEKRRSNDAREDIENNSANVLTRLSLSETRGKRRGYGSAEHLALPTVFEGKITKERKVSKHEKLSTIVNLRRSGSNKDVRGVDPRPLSPFLSRLTPQKSVDDNAIYEQSLRSGVRRIQRNFSSPFPTGEQTSSPLSIRGRALSDSSAEAPVSPVIPRRHFESGNCHSPKQSQGGISRVKSCPVMPKADSNEPLAKFSFPSTLSPLSKSPSTDACSILRPDDQSDRLPQIDHSHSPMLVHPVPTRKTPNEYVREMFNVSPIMDQSGNFLNQADDNNLQCKATDKVEYYLYSMSVEDVKD